MDGGCICVVYVVLLRGVGWVVLVGLFQRPGIVSWCLWWFGYRGPLIPRLRLTSVPSWLFPWWCGVGFLVGSC